MVDKIIQFIAKLPSTQIRILVTVAIWIGTAIWVFTGGIPSIEFLATIVAMSGLDAMTFGVKRATEHKPTEIAQAEAIRKNGNGVSHQTNMPSSGGDERG